MRLWVEDIKEGQSAFDNTDPAKRPQRMVKGVIVSNENKNGDKYTRCFWDKVCPCIHTRNDIFASQATIHPADDRVLSVRELMKLMSIPDSFNWSSIPEEKLNKFSSLEKRTFLKKEETNIRQSIGEAVPTTIFNQIARNIKDFLTMQKLDLNTIKKIILSENLVDKIKLQSFLKNNIDNYTYWELAKIIELSNAERDKHAAYYTRQDICFTIIKDLPDASKYEELKILEPSVGAGNFLPLLIEKYKTVRNVEIDVVDIDSNAIDILKILIKKLKIPENIKINFINEDFLFYGRMDLFDQYKHYDIAIGNPPFGNITLNPNILKEYKKNLYNDKTNNIFSFFFEKCIKSSDIVGLILPKSFLSAPEFNKTRELVSNFSVRKITDYGERAFKGVKIETISVIVDTTRKGSETLVESYVKNQIELKEQDYICTNDFPYWLVYRNEFFDRVAKKLKFNIFSTFRDRQITKRITKGTGKIRVLKSRNIADNKIKNIPAYDSYIDYVDTFVVSRFMNKTDSVIVPNLTYYPRASFLPKNTIADGSVAVLTVKDQGVIVTKEDLSYYSTPEYTEFYKVARNFGTRSLNIDNNSVFFFGVKR